VFSFANGYTTTYSEDDSHFFTMLFMPYYDDITDYFEILIKQVKESLSCSIDIFYCHTGFRELRAAVRYVTAMDYLGYQNSTVTKLYPTAEHRNFDAASQNYRDYYQQIKQYIRDNVSMQITRQAISDHIHISPDYISHIVRTIAECSCKELIAREKMQYAHTLIQTTSKSIGDIAVECGFDSFAYFSKVYKSIYGISPKSTRK
jgi:YesN/AraC family two-component response regulator